MMTDRIDVGLIYGSTREGRFCDTVAQWTRAQLEARREFSLEPIDPAALELPARHEARPGAAVHRLRERLARADAFVVVTPEYNHGYPAPLKFLIDSASEEWHAKPVAFVSYGGISGGLRAVEQLRPVFAELHAVTVRESVSFAHPWEQLDADGALRASESAGRGIAAMLARLHWWALALRDARRTRDYRLAV